MTDTPTRTYSNARRQQNWSNVPDEKQTHTVTNRGTV